MSGVVDLISAVQSVKQLCDSVSASKQVVRFAGEKLMTMVPLLELLEQEEDESYPEATNEGGGQVMVQSLHMNLLSMEKTVKKAKRMNTLMYVIKAANIHDELEASMRQMHFTLGSLSVRQNISIQRQLRQIQNDWHMGQKDLAQLKRQETEAKMDLLQGDAVSNLLKAANGSKRDLREVQEAMVAERQEMQKTVTKFQRNNDGVRRSKLDQEEECIRQIIGALALAEEQTDVSEVVETGKDEAIPDWAICPVTQEIMKDPVQVDAICHHTFERSTLVEWLHNRRKDTCPACSQPLRSLVISPNPIARHAIEDLTSRAQGNLSPSPGTTNLLPLSSGTTKATQVANNQELNTEAGLELVLGSEDTSRLRVSGLIHPSKISKARDGMSETMIEERKISPAKVSADENRSRKCCGKRVLAALVAAGVAGVVGVIIAMTQPLSPTDASKTPTSSLANSPTDSLALPILTPDTSNQPQPGYIPGSTTPSTPIPTPDPTTVPTPRPKPDTTPEPTPTPTPGHMELVVTCIPPAGAENCNATPPPVELCVGRPFEMVFLYNGGSCAQSYNGQEAGGKFTCEDFGGGPPVEQGEKSYIVVTALRDDSLYHSDWVEVGGLFTLSDGGNRFAADQLITVYRDDNINDPANILQSVIYHSSCSSNLFLMDRFGAVQLVTYVNEEQGTVSSFVNQTFELDITVPSDIEGGPLTVESLTVTSNVDPFFFNRTDKVAGILLDAGERLVTTISIPIDLSPTFSASLRSRLTPNTVLNAD